MRDEELNLEPEDRDVERALVGLQPAGPNRDAIMFAAGSRAGRRPVRVWRGMAAVLALSTGLSLSLHHAVAPAHRSVVRMEAVSSPAPSVADTTGPFTAASLRAAILERGVDGLPSAPQAPNGSPAAPTPSVRDLGNPS